MKYIKLISPQKILKLLSTWPPFLAAGIKIKEVNQEVNMVKVEMNQRFYNTNYVGTHFGGSLYSMCDPFYMFILLHHLGKDHVVWDKSAHIDFLRPGQGRVWAEFNIPLNIIEDIKNSALEHFKVEPVFETYVYNNKNEPIAKVTKTLYVRRKDAKTRFKKSS
jgi:acyl-coenzyme A thioesterase PaaI-like protein